MMTDNGFENMTFFMGVVENTVDPAGYGRIQVRAFGFHPPIDSPEPERVETEDLPWALLINGTGGKFFSLPDVGDVAFGFFLDGRDAQHPYILGFIHNANMATPYSGSYTNQATAQTGTDYSETGDRQRANEDGTQRDLPPPSDGTSPGYPEDMSQAEIERIIREESNLRGIDPDVAVRIFRAEGAGSYQSQVPRSASQGGSLNGREASFGPYQLYVGGGLGNDYQNRTGRNLVADNTREGITNQIRYSLDQATRPGGWQPWYGRGPAGVGVRQGLEGSRPVNNWE